MFGASKGKISCKHRAVISIALTIRTRFFSHAEFAQSATKAKRRGKNREKNMCVYRLDTYFKTKAGLLTIADNSDLLAFISYFALFNDAGN